MRHILMYLKPNIRTMCFGFTVKFTAAMADLLLPWILAYIIDEVTPTKNIGLVLIWGLLMLASSIVSITFNICANRIAAKVSRKTTEQIRHDLFARISYLSNSQVNAFGIPSLISRMTSDTYNIHQMLSIMQRMGVRAPILLIGGIIITSTLDFYLTLVLVATLPLIVLIVYVVTKLSFPLYILQQTASDKLVRKVRESIVGIRVIKALSKTSYEKEQFAKINKEVVTRERKAGVTTAIINPSMSLILNIGLTIIVVVGAQRVDSGLTEVGKIIAFLTYFTLILNAMLAMTRIFVVYSKASASANRISEILIIPEDLVARHESVKKPFKDEVAHIEFKNVSFAYDDSENTLTDISFSLNKGESLGIIGATGSGKTTLINLLLRFYDADSGEIIIDGKNINSIDKDELSKMFGVVFQNDIIFKDTVRNNITLGRELDDERVRAASKFAQAYEFIEGMDEKFDSAVAIRGANLSGGQKQRLLISRSLVGDPKILILDDSSSALDYKTDALLRKEIKDNFNDTTIVIIAQRVSSVMTSDKILVLENGKMIECGSHDELMGTCNVYKQIALSQMGDLIDEK